MAFDPAVRIFPVDRRSGHFNEVPMSYFIYRITESPIRRLEKLERHDIYREASTRAKDLRAALAADAPHTIRMIHAESELQAEDLLNQLRERSLEPDDD